MSGGLRRWGCGILLVGLVGCGAPSARPTPLPPEPTATVKRAVATPTPIPTEPGRWRGSPTAPPVQPSPTMRPFPTPEPTQTFALVRPFQPHPFPDGFHTGGNWIAVQVDTYDSSDQMDWTLRRSDLWFTDGQRWVGPMRLTEAESTFMWDESWDAFWRRDGEGFQLCADLKSRLVCVPAPPGSAPSVGRRPSVQVTVCQDGSALCVVGADGSTRMIPLPDKLWKEWGLELISEPICISQDRWAIVFLNSRPSEVPEVPKPDFIYRVDLQTGAFDKVYSEPIDDAFRHRIEEFQRQGVLPPWIYWIYEPASIDVSCSPDTRFVLIPYFGGMGGSENSAWILRVEDNVMYPLPGYVARWVRPAEENGGR